MLVGQHALAMVNYLQRHGAGRQGLIGLVHASSFHALQAVEGFRYRSISEGRDEQAISSTEQARSLGARTDSALLGSASQQ